MGPVTVEAMVLNMAKIVTRFILHPQIDVINLLYVIYATSPHENQAIFLERIPLISEEGGQIK